MTTNTPVHSTGPHPICSRIEVISSQWDSLYIPDPQLKCTNAYSLWTDMSSTLSKSCFTRRYSTSLYTAFIWLQQFPCFKPKFFDTDFFIDFTVTLAFLGLLLVPPAPTFSTPAYTSELLNPVCTTLTFRVTSDLYLCSTFCGSYLSSSFEVYVVHLKDIEKYGT